jgi:hypothetical protein
MQSLSRTIGLGFILLTLAALAAKIVVPLPGLLGYAPVDLGIAAPVQPVELVVWYSTEKEAWLEEAAQRFEASGANLGGRPIRVRLVGMGSGELVERVAGQDWRGAPPPAAVAPASSMWVDRLRAEWAARAGGEIVSGGAAPLALTPLVAVAWQERADLIWSGDPGAFWGELHDALVAQGGWSEVAAGRGFGPGTPVGDRAAGWGFVKFGHTSPLSSNSGAQTLALLAYAYHGKTAGLTTADIADPGFQAWLEQIEGATLDFGESTGSFMTNMVRFGPSRYDAVMVYENLAIASVEAAERQWGPARVYYPPATMISDHPLAILGEPLTTGDQRAAAAQFRDYLLSRPLQELALQRGFRPANPAVSIAGAASPFGRLASYGVRPEVGQQVETPAPEVAAALAELWELKIAPLTIRN